MSGDDLPPARESASALPDRSSAFFSALLTEQFVQQSVRGVTVSESSSRASLYMFTLSSALIAYGFLADTDVAAAYLGVVLPIVFLLGHLYLGTSRADGAGEHHRRGRHPADPPVLCDAASRCGLFLPAAH
jgi:hypothetical protein